MTETLPSVSSMPNETKKTRRVSRSETERAAVRELVKAARGRGEDLTGPNGLLKVLTKDVLDRHRGGDDRAPRLRQKRRRGPKQR